MRKLTQEEGEALCLRYRNSARHFPGQILRQILRLDLYRLLSHVYASPSFTDLSVSAKCTHSNSFAMNTSDLMRIGAEQGASLVHGFGVRFCNCT
jgi:hypothetical protein